MMIEDRPYAGILMKDGTEIAHYGVKGMKWGKRTLGKVKSLFGKPSSISSQMQNALKPKETISSAPVGKQRGGKKVNTVNGNSTGVNLTSKAAITAAQGQKQRDRTARQSEKRAALNKNSLTKKEKERKKRQSYVDNYNWHHN